MDRLLKLQKTGAFLHKTFERKAINMIECRVKIISPFIFSDFNFQDCFITLSTP